MYCTDMEDAQEKCSMCGKEEIRYLHTISHPDEGISIDVGAVCARRLTNNAFGITLGEESLKKRAARLKKWLTRKWRISSRGNKFLNIEGNNVGVYQARTGKWGYWINSYFSDKFFSNEDSAKLALFNDFWESILNDD